MLFISTDEGSSFQRQSIAFTPDTLIFHPKEEDKLLAFCKEGRVGCTAHTGNKIVNFVAEIMHQKILLMLHIFVATATV